MPNSEKNYSRVRSALRGTLKRTENYLNSHEKLSSEEIESRLQSLETTLHKFLQIQEEIELYTDDDHLEFETEQRYEFEELSQTPYRLMFGRDVRTKLHVMFKKPPVPTIHPYNNPLPTRYFAPGDRVQARCYATPNKKWTFGTISRRLGNLHYQVRTDEGLLWTRHLDQLLPAPRVTQPGIGAEV
ncbi:hypothetical protein ACJJTC_006649 [Scirpophaga incertulas]